MLNVLQLRFFESLGFCSSVDNVSVLLGFDPTSLAMLGHFDLEAETTILSSDFGNPVSSDTSFQKNANLNIFLNLMPLKSLQISVSLYFYTVFIDRHLVASTSTDPTRKYQ
jgi:hypothetical protein